MKPQCSIEGCKKLAHARGWCAMHWARWRANGSTYRPPRPTGCKVDGCDKDHYARDYCRRHYGQYKRGLTPTLYKTCLHCGDPVRDRVANAELHEGCVEPRERDLYYRREYGLTFDEYEALRTYQMDRCAICFQQYGNELHVDHNHLNGSVRGLLCGDCNRALGCLQDNPTSLRAAIQYLTMPPAVQHKINKLVPGVAL